MLSTGAQNRAWKGMALVSTLALVACSFDGGVASTLSDAGVLADARVDAAEPVCPSNDEELLLCMQFEHTTGETVLADESQYANDATAQNADFVLGPYNQALVSDVDSDARIMEAESLDPLLQLTIEMWLRPDAQVNGRQWLFDNNSQWALYLDNRNRLGCDLRQGREIVTSNDVIVPGTFQHVACVYDGEFLKLFVEGRRVEAARFTGDLEQNTMDGSCIAEDCPGGGGEYIGQMDTLRIWESARPRLKICEAAGLSPGSCPEEPPDPMP